MEKSFYWGLALGLGVCGVSFLILGWILFAVDRNCPGFIKRKPGFFSKENIRFIYGGIVTLIISFSAIGFLILGPDFERYPSEESVLAVADMISSKVRFFWGDINVFSALILLSVAVVLVFGGFEGWKRGGQSRFWGIVCWLMALMVAVIGVVQP